MKLIKPSEISGRILSLLDESDEWVIIVSPYVKITNWYKLINKLDALKSRKIPMKIYVRDDPENEITYRELKRQNLEYRKLPNLHSKFYMNEKQGISTSMNLLLTSEINSLEMGYITETREDYSDMFDYYQRFIRAGEPHPPETFESQAAAVLIEQLKSNMEGLKTGGKRAWFWMEEHMLHIRSGRNTYRISIFKGLLLITASLRIESAFVHGDSISLRMLAKKAGDLSAMTVTVLASHPPDFLELRGQGKKHLESPCISRVLKSEITLIVESIRRFMDCADKLKI